MPELFCVVSCLSCFAWSHAWVILCGLMPLCDLMPELLCVISCLSCFAWSHAWVALLCDLMPELLLISCLRFCVVSCLSCFVWSHAWVALMSELFCVVSCLSCLAWSHTWVTLCIVSCLTCSARQRKVSWWWGTPSCRSNSPAYSSSWLSSRETPNCSSRTATRPFRARRTPSCSSTAGWLCWKNR